jgi:hypothetical protein
MGHPPGCSGPLLQRLMVLESEYVAWCAAERVADGGQRVELALIPVVDLPPVRAFRCVVRRILSNRRGVRPSGPARVVDQGEVRRERALRDV